MAHTISRETAEKIHAVWMAGEETTLGGVMVRAGIQTRDDRNLRHYRRVAEEMLGVEFPPLNARSAARNLPKHAERIEKDGTYVIFSDAHWWPDTETAAYRILLQVIADTKPDVVIDNGDSWDGASISRHPPTMWERKPSLKQELEAVQGYLTKIAQVAREANKPVELYRTIGNHDLRFEAILATRCPELIGMPSTTAAELFPLWEHNISLVINSEVVVKHRFRNGIHAAWNNVLHGGCHVVTAHSHRLRCIPFTNYRGTFYGVETGTLSEPWGDQFFYCEDNPRNWQQGFVVLTMDGPRPHFELVEAVDGRAMFRGRRYSG